MSSDFYTYESWVVDPLLLTSLPNIVSEWPVTILLSGVPGSGKSTLAKAIAAKCTTLQRSSSIFSTDQFFIDPKSRDYKFDASKLKEYHDSNFKAFCEDNKSDVRIVDNTNLQKWEYQRYAKDAVNRGQICLIIQMKLPNTRTDPVENYAKRNTHSVPASRISDMVKRAQILSHSYLGAFITRESVEVHFPDKTTQKTPLHVTLYYHNPEKELKSGGHIDANNVHVGKTAAMWPEEVCIWMQHYLGSKCTLKICGISTNEAGIALVVSLLPILDFFAPYKTEKNSQNAQSSQTCTCAYCSGQHPRFHITLHTNDKFTPKDVGSHICQKNIVEVTEVELSGIVSVQL